MGTNSIHLIVVELDSFFGTARTLARQREMVRLGSGETLTRGQLGRKAIARGVAAIVRFVEQARALGAEDIRAVATSAVRESANREEFVSAVREACGIELEVLDGNAEARLIHLGVSRGYPLGEGMSCIVDIGGGSTEFIVGDAERPYFLRSVPLGSLRLFEEFLRDARDQNEAARRMDAHIRRELGAVAEQLREYRFDMMIGTSGTIMGVGALDAARRGKPDGRVHGYELRLDAMRDLQRTMLRLSPAERRKLPGMNPRRSDIIVAGNAVAIASLEMIGKESLRVCDRALRDGIVLDSIERDQELQRRLGDERTGRLDAVHELARRFHGGGSHEIEVGMLALQLFDGLREVHGFEAFDRDVLFAAALLHDIGHCINASAHHKHGAYLLRGAGLPGWRRDQVELIAALVRYHRKAMPKLTHPEYAAAEPQTRKRIAGLSALLRIADGLDRRHLSLVTGVEITLGVHSVEIVALAWQPIVPEIEAARFKADLFERTFGIRPEIVACVADGDPSRTFDPGDDRSEIEQRTLGGLRA
ncbi:MAG TPA: Ppx/GppA phosphatase family protein [Candidatus Baltobacteraceae bacterium]|nr:Ppx/GppA phosphatase family protein [Candidatus Baltobacteraceae bacterium]